MTGSFDPGLIPLYTTQFSTNLELLLQQRSSKLRGRVREGAHIGKMASPVNQVGALSMKAPAGRFAPLPAQQAAYSRRWVFPQEGELPQLVDTFDELQTVVDPKSALAETASAAAGRAWDDGRTGFGLRAGGLCSDRIEHFQCHHTASRPDFRDRKLF